MLNLLLQTAENGEEGGSGLIEVVPGLMIWTLVCFGIAFFVLRKYAFGPIQKAIDERRERIRQAVDEADNARNEARELLEQNRAILAQARSESADILAEARKVGDAQIERAKQEAESERQRRLEQRTDLRQKVHFAGSEVRKKRLSAETDTLQRGGSADRFVIGTHRGWSAGLWVGYTSRSQSIFVASAHSSSSL